MSSVSGRHVADNLQSVRHLLRATKRASRSSEHRARIVQEARILLDYAKEHFANEAQLLIDDQRDDRGRHEHLRCLRDLASIGSTCAREYVGLHERRRWTMRNHSVTHLLVDAVAQALADPIRREILAMLHEAPRMAGAIAEAFAVSRPAVSRHLRVLREAGLVRDTVSGREHEYTLALEALEPLEAFLAKLRGPSAWNRRLDALETEVHRVRRRREAGEQAAKDDSRTKTTKRKTA
jgi:DNA-binding transcriptional ArsR family regulator